MARTALHSRDESLERALHLFWRQGFGATSLKDLEHALDMRPGSIYATFGSKDALFREALERYAERSMAELERAIASETSALGGLVAYVRMLGGLRDRGETCPACMLVKSLLELGEQEDAAAHQVETFLAAMERRFTERFAAARGAGEIAAELDPARLGRRLQADVVGLRTYAQRDVSDAAVRELAEDIACAWERLREPSARS